MQTANVLVPIATRDKRMLLHFGVTGADGRAAHRIARKSSAAIQGEYLRRLALTSPAGDDRLFLRALGDYGRRYEVVVETHLPIRAPVTLRLTEDRALRLTGRGWTEQHVVFGDARSTHIEARTTDHTVQISRFEVEDLSGARAAPAWFEGVHWTSEALQLYSSEPGRPYYVTVRLRFASDRYIVVTGLLLATITRASAVVAALVERQVIAVLALLTVPTTLAATLALIRDQTALASRVLAPLRTLIEVAIGALWVVVLVRTVAIAVSGI